MRAQLVSENINFERGGEDHIYTKIGIGERERVLKFLDEVAGDIQFQRDEPEYMGHLNIEEDLFLDIYPQYKEAYQMFVKNWRKYLPDLGERGLYVIDPPTIDKTIFYDEPAKGGFRAIQENMEFERGKDPLSTMGLGQVSKIPLLILKADLQSGYGIDGFPGTIHTIQVIGPRRFQINFSHDRIKNLSTNKSISKPSYAEFLVSEIGIEKFITNMVHAHGTGQSWIFTLHPKYANAIPRETYDYDDLGDDDPLKESNFERGKEPKRAMGIGRKFRKGDTIKFDHYSLTNHPLGGGYHSIVSSKVYEIEEKGTGDYLLVLINGNFATIPADREDIELVEPANESRNFERGKDPYDALDVGRKALLKKKANEIEWDWYPDPTELETEEVIDIKQYKGFNTKIAKIKDPNSYRILPDGGAEKVWTYYAVSDTGEPYFEEPTFYKDPENAWHYERQFLDEYYEENQ